MYNHTGGTSFGTQEHCISNYLAHSLVINMPLTPSKENIAKAVDRKSSLQRAGPYENPVTKVARVADGSGMAIDLAEDRQNYANTLFTAVAEGEDGLAQRLFKDGFPGGSSDFGGGAERKRRGI